MNKKGMHTHFLGHYLESRIDKSIRDSYTYFLYFMFDFDNGRTMVGMFYRR